MKACVQSCVAVCLCNLQYNNDTRLAYCDNLFKLRSHFIGFREQLGKFSTWIRDIRRLYLLQVSDLNANFDCPFASLLSKFSFILPKQTFEVPRLRENEIFFTNKIIFCLRSLIWSRLVRFPMYLEILVEIDILFMKIKQLWWVIIFQLKPH